MKKLLIDSDIIAFRAAAACEVPVNWGKGLWTLHSYEEDVIAHMEDQLYVLRKDAPVDGLLMAMSDSKNYRKKVAPYYKANRKDIRKPILLQFAKEYLRESYESVTYPMLETDDVLGILGTTHKDSIIWSIDKDLLTIPAKHWIEGEVVEVTEKEANRKFLEQCLTGDSTDNYRGCPGVGPKAAIKILDEECSWKQVVKAYEDKGLSKEVALENARLARILRKGEYDIKKGEVKLWDGK